MAYLRWQSGILCWAAGAWQSWKAWANAPDSRAYSMAWSNKPSLISSWLPSSGSMLDAHAKATWAWQSNGLLHWVCLQAMQRDSRHCSCIRWTTFAAGLTCLVARAPPWALASLKEPSHMPTALYICTAPFQSPPSTKCLSASLKDDSPCSCFAISTWVSASWPCRRR